MLDAALVSKEQKEGQDRVTDQRLTAGESCRQEVAPSAVQCVNADDSTTSLAAQRPSTSSAKPAAAATPSPSLL